MLNHAEQGGPQGGRQLLELGHGRQRRDGLPTGHHVRDLQPQDLGVVLAGLARLHRRRPAHEPHPHLAVVERGAGAHVVLDRARPGRSTTAPARCSRASRPLLTTPAAHAPCRATLRRDSLIDTPLSRLLWLGSTGAVVGKAQRLLGIAATSTFDRATRVPCCAIPAAATSCPVPVRSTIRPGQPCPDLDQGQQARLDSGSRRALGSTTRLSRGAQRPMPAAKVYALQSALRVPPASEPATTAAPPGRRACPPRLGWACRDAAGDA